MLSRPALGGAAGGNAQLLADRRSGRVGVTGRLALIVVLAVCYVAKLVMITIASSLLLAFVLKPIV